jgi:hypothetical protein
MYSHRNIGEFVSLAANTFAKSTCFADLLELGRAVFKIIFENSVTPLGGDHDSQFEKYELAGSS